MFLLRPSGVERLLRLISSTISAEAVADLGDGIFHLHGLSWIDGVPAGSARILGRFRLIDRSCRVFTSGFSDDFVW